MHRLFVHNDSDMPNPNKIMSKHIAATLVNSIENYSFFFFRKKLLIQVHFIYISEGK